MVPNPDNEAERNKDEEHRDQAHQEQAQEVAHRHTGSGPVTMPITAPALPPSLPQRAADYRTENEQNHAGNDPGLAPARTGQCIDQI